MSRKEEKKALVSSHTQPLQDFGETHLHEQARSYGLGGL
jgi:hypothetical protein